MKHTDKEIEKFLNEYKTPCCYVVSYRKGRADFRCKKCDVDVTMDLYLLYKALTNKD